MADKEFSGMLELIGDKRYGFIRDLRPDLPKDDDDPFVPPPLIRKFNLRDGLVLEGTLKPGRKGGTQVDEIHQVQGVPPETWVEVDEFGNGPSIYPEEKLDLVTGPNDVSMRVVDLVAPIGKGQRALIVAPPRTGKTVLLKQMASSISENHPEVELVGLLVDERPEEVTDFKRSTPAQIFASSNDRDQDNHVRVSTLALEYAKRLVELRRDVVLLLDSLTRLGRTFNLYVDGSGRTLSGGLDANALNVPRKIFASARNVEGGGSLTIIATALIETGSRMDEVIFEEFKGTGNSEIVLNREMADKRIFPAIDLRKSGTRNEERLLGDATERHHMLFRALNSRSPVEGMQALLRHIGQSPTNKHLLNELVSA
jgi:transcription termination factor Rho